MARFSHAGEDASIGTLTCRVVKDVSHGIHHEGKDGIEGQERRDREVKQSPASHVIGGQVVGDHEQCRRWQHRVHLLLAGTK